MNDIYLKVANSQIGKNLLEALNLPTPPELYRTPDDVLSTPSGRVLLAAGKNSVAYGQLLKALDSDSVKLFTPLLEGKNQQLLANQSRVRLENTPKSVRLDGNATPRFRFVVFDGTGITSQEDATVLLKVLQPAIKGLKRNGKVVVIGRALQNTKSPEQAGFAAGLEGFVKSLAKEIGHKGATCNLIQLEEDGEKAIRNPLYYLLTPKSAFVSGQTLTISKTGASKQRINWTKPLINKVALVTGAAQGIGAETARVLSRDGATVICLDIPANEKSLKTLANEIDGHPLLLDLGQPNTPKEILNTLASSMGGVDIIVHNAGITRDKTFGKMPQHFWDQVLGINLSAIEEINRLLLNHNTLNKNGRIICISSISGIAGNFGQTNYAYSKAGVAGYTQALSKTLENGITINAIAPGFIETQMTGKIPFMTREMGRRTSSLSQGGLPLDVAEAVSLFSHPGSGALNGNLLRVCGQSLLGK